jgi:hypothetical protein
VENQLRRQAEGKVWGGEFQVVFKEYENIKGTDSQSGFREIRQ